MTKEEESVMSVRQRATIINESTPLTASKENENPNVAEQSIGNGVGNVRVKSEENMEISVVSSPSNYGTESRKTASPREIDFGRKSSEDSGGSNKSNNTERNKDRKKKKGVKLTPNATFRLEQRVQMHMVKHGLAWLVLSSRQFWFFTVPQALLTLMTGTLAFLATTELFDERTKVVINIIVGSTSGVVVFLQTMSGVCDYGTRAAMHDSTSIDLRDLRDDLVLLKQKLNLVKRHNQRRVDAMKGASPAQIFAATNNDDDDDNNEEHGNSFETIQTRFQQSLSGCASTVPMVLSDCFHGLDSNLMLSRTDENMAYLMKKYKNVDLQIRDVLYYRAYDILSSEISSSPGFPLRFPIPKKVVAATMERLHEQLTVTVDYRTPKLDSLV